MMKIFSTLLVAVTAAVLLGLSAPAPPAEAAGWERIHAAELEAMIEEGGEDLVIVDVREPWLYREGHVPGAVNIPFDGAHERVLDELDPGERIVFVCHGGPMGDELGALLTSKGYGKVYNLIGGMRAWDGPLESGESGEGGSE